MKVPALGETAVKGVLFPNPVGKTHCGSLENPADTTSGGVFWERFGALEKLLSNSSLKKGSPENDTESVNQNPENQENHADKAWLSAFHTTLQTVGPVGVERVVKSVSETTPPTTPKGGPRPRYNLGPCGT